MNNNTKRAIKIVATVMMMFVIFITNTGIVNADEYAKYGKRDELSEYTIKPGDTMEDVAFNNGFTVEELATLNNIKDVNNIHVGDVLTLDYSTATSEELIAFSNDYQSGSNVNDVNYDTAKDAGLLNEYYMTDDLQYNHNTNKHIFKYVKNNKLYTTKKSIKQIKEFVLNHNINEKFYIDGFSNL